VNLERFVREQMQQEALDAFNVRKKTTFQNLRAIVGLALALLKGGGLIAVATSLAVGRAVVQNQRAVAEHGERLRTTLASIGDGVLTTDTTGLITNLNPLAEALTGWKHSERASSSAWRITPS
jgi:PAS domain-containing protein